MEAVHSSMSMKTEQSLKLCEEYDRINQIKESKLRWVIVTARRSLGKLMNLSFSCNQNATENYTTTHRHKFSHLQWIQLYMCTDRSPEYFYIWHWRHRQRLKRCTRPHLQGKFKRFTMEISDVATVQHSKVGRTQMLTKRLLHLYEQSYKGPLYLIGNL